MPTTPSGVQQRDVNVLTTSTPLLDYNPNRVALIIAPRGVTRFTVSLLPTAVLGQGIDLNEDDGPFCLYADRVGNALTGPMSAIADTTARIITVWEFLKAP